jgi:exosortase
VCIAVLVLAIHGPLMLIYARRLIRVEHYEFAPLLLVAVGMLLFQRRRSLRGAARSDSTPVRTSMIGLCLLAAAIWLRSPWLAAVSFVGVAGLLLRDFSGRYRRELLFAWAPLLLLIRPPFALDVVVMQSLQGKTSLWASGLLDVFGIPHLRNGSILEVPGRQFFVEEACSGIHSVFALLAWAALYVAWARVPVVRAVLLLACAVIWACAANLVRIIVILASHELWGLDLTQGFIHDGLGGVMFLLAAGLLVMSDRFLQFWLDPIKDDYPGAAEVIRTHRLARSWNAVVRAPAPVETPEALPDSPSETSLTQSGSPAPRSPARGRLVSVGLTVCAVAIALWEVDALPPTYAEDEETTAHAQKLSSWLQGVDEATLPADVGKWQRIAYGEKPLWGEPERVGVSRIWTYATPHGPAVVSLDSPFEGWHDVTQCYLGSGAAVESYLTRRVQPRGPQTPAGDDSPATVTEVVLRYPSGIRALLLFINFDEAGRNLENRSAWVHADEPVRWIVESVAARIAADPWTAEAPHQITQFQLLVEFDDVEPLPALCADASEKFATFSREIKRRLSSVP